ncbi:N-acetyl sugar amidotransferase [Alphaproteobacteria bacterium]|nr:N-acetyl sugar amidotransferase [Alphaproteobacteria bacterium]
MAICSRCIFSDDKFDISFDRHGVCSVCTQIDYLAELYGTGQDKGKETFANIVAQIKKDGKNKAYDCVIGVSGGTDSSYLLLMAISLGLRPLAVHYDNTWNKSVATQNIKMVTSALNIDLFTHVIDAKEHDAIKLAYMKAGVQEFDTDTDLGFVQLLRQTAAKFKVKYILEGHSFMEEGISPLRNNYFDGGYIKDIVTRYSTIKLKTYPLMDFWQFLKWVLIYRQKFIRPLWYIEYSKSEARTTLCDKTGWKYYGGHHLENRASEFAHAIWIPLRYGSDYRVLTLSAEVRNGKKDRKEALAELQKPILRDDDLIDYVCKRTGISTAEFDALFTAPHRDWREFKTYKKRFELLRPLFYIFAKANLVPMSFYLKYCFPIEKK